MNLFLVILTLFLLYVYYYSTIRNGIAIVCVMKNPPNIEHWLNFHRKRGITQFLIRLEDTPQLISFLNTQPDVYLTIGSSKDNPDYYQKDYNAQIARQRKFVKESINFCVKKGIKWIAHIDCDELIDCDGSTIQQTLESEIMSNDKIHNIVMENYEIKYKKLNNSCFEPKESDNLLNCKNGGCVSYANGKSIGRVSEKLEEHGVHRFIVSPLSKNYEFNSQKIRVLHYESCDFNSYVSKFMDLANQNSDKIYPFEFYNESIKLAKSDKCKNKGDCEQKFKELYSKFKLIR